MSRPDYYAILGVLPTAPDAEITRAWRRLVLASHPDKKHASSSSSPSSLSPSPSPSPQNGDSSDPDIRLINEARAVLCDPLQRAAFDQEREGLGRSSHTTPAPPPPSGPRIREYVSLEAFTPQPDADDPERFVLECRCGQDYVVTVDDLEAGVDVVGCPGCGEYVGVEYEVVEEE